jgi:hypothetical protein
VTEREDREGAALSAKSLRVERHRELECVEDREREGQRRRIGARSSVVIIICES